MIEKLPNFDSTEASIYHVEKLYARVNQLIDAVNGILDYAPLEMAQKAEPDYVTTSYMTDGHTKEYYGQNGARIVADPPLPAGYVITIKESETKGGDNE